MPDLCDACGLTTETGDEVEFADCIHCGGHHCVDCFSQYHGDFCEEREKA